MEALAQAELDAGHPETALDFYFQAAALYGGAQHVIFETNDEKHYLYAGVRRCYDQVIALAPLSPRASRHPLERHAGVG
jgi:hypothetical protein